MVRRQRRIGKVRNGLTAEREYSGKMAFLARHIDHFFNGDLRGQDRTTGFVLMVFRFADRGHANYMSNTSREDVVAMLKEQIARFEGQPEQKGTA